jgi:hypothetical protein
MTKALNASILTHWSIHWLDDAEIVIEIDSNEREADVVHGD